MLQPVAVAFDPWTVLLRNRIPSGFGLEDVPIRVHNLRPHGTKLHQLHGQAKADVVIGKANDLGELKAEARAVFGLPPSRHLAANRSVIQTSEATRRLL